MKKVFIPAETLFSIKKGLEAAQAAANVNSKEREGSYAYKVGAMETYIANTLETVDQIITKKKLDK